MSEKVNYYLELCSEFVLEIAKDEYEEEPHQEDDLFDRICNEFPELEEDEELTSEELDELATTFYKDYIDEYEYWREYYGVPEPEEDLDIDDDEDDDWEDDDEDSEEILVTLHNSDKRIRDISYYASDFGFKAKLIDSYKSALPDDHGLRIDVWELYGTKENLLEFFENYSIPYWDTDIVVVGHRYSNERFEIDESLREDAFDLRWEEELWCAHCKDDLKPHEGIEVNKKLYCEYCYKNYCFECPECGEEFCMDDVYCCPGATEDNEEDIYYCYNCWEKIFFECHNCENIFYKEDGFEDENGELYCRNCVEQ